MSMMICTWTGTLAAELGDWTTPLPAPQLQLQLHAHCSLWGISRRKSQLHPTATYAEAGVAQHTAEHMRCVWRCVDRSWWLAVAQYPCPLSDPNRQGPVRDFQIRAVLASGPGSAMFADKFHQPEPADGQDVCFVGRCLPRYSRTSRRS